MNWIEKKMVDMTSGDTQDIDRQGRQGSVLFDCNTGQSLHKLQLGGGGIGRRGQPIDSN